MNTFGYLRIFLFKRKLKSVSTTAVLNGSCVVDKTTDRMFQNISHFMNRESLKLKNKNQRNITNETY